MGSFLIFFRCQRDPSAVSLLFFASTSSVHLLLSVNSLCMKNLRNQSTPVLPIHFEVMLWRRAAGRTFIIFCALISLLEAGLPHGLHCAEGWTSVGSGTSARCIAAKRCPSKDDQNCTRQVVEQKCQDHGSSLASVLNTEEIDRMNELAESLYNITIEEKTCRRFWRFLCWTGLLVNNSGTFWSSDKDYLTEIAVPEQRTTEFCLFIGIGSLGYAYLKCEEPLLPGCFICERPMILVSTASTVGSTMSTQTSRATQSATTNEIESSMITRNSPKLPGIGISNNSTSSCNQSCSKDISTAYIEPLLKRSTLIAIKPIEKTKNRTAKSRRKLVNLTVLTTRKKAFSRSILATTSSIEPADSETTKAIKKTATYTNCPWPWSRVGDDDSARCIVAKRCMGAGCTRQKAEEQCRNLQGNLASVLSYDEIRKMVELASSLYTKKEIEGKADDIWCWTGLLVNDTGRFWASGKHYQTEFTKSLERRGCLFIGIDARHKVFDMDNCNLVVGCSICEGHWTNVSAKALLRSSSAARSRTVMAVVILFTVPSFCARKRYS